MLLSAVHIYLYRSFQTPMMRSCRQRVVPPCSSAPPRNHARKEAIPVRLAPSACPSRVVGFPIKGRPDGSPHSAQQPPLFTNDHSQPSDICPTLQLSPRRIHIPLQDSQSNSQCVRFFQFCIMHLLLNPPLTLQPQPTPIPTTSTTTCPQSLLPSSSVSPLDFLQVGHSSQSLVQPLCR